MNRIVLVGRLTKAPEKKIVKESGKIFTRIMLAVNRPFKSPKGEREVDFIPVVLWGKKAEIVCEYMEKGSKISITGRLQTRSYDDKDGNRKYVSEVIADEFQFVDYKKPDQDII